MDWARRSLNLLSQIWDIKVCLHPKPPDWPGVGGCLVQVWGRNILRKTHPPSSSGDIQALVRGGHYRSKDAYFCVLFFLSSVYSNYFKDKNRCIIFLQFMGLLVM
uniref:Uncharacterized protein n=1 Tax=Laticauda laticaudata TaxID=8630 RepID=A0A8C5T1U2_LATLA